MFVTTKRSYGTKKLYFYPSTTTTNQLSLQDIFFFAPSGDWLVEKGMHLKAFHRNAW
jgi:threonine aldolase